MKYTVYVLRSLKDKKLYIGSTNNVSRRILEHSNGTTKSLKKLLPVKLVFYQKYLTIKIARKVEIKLKRFKNKRIIEKIIKNKKITLRM